MPESEHNNSDFAEAESRSQQRENFANWHSSDAQTSYMREVGKIDLLSADEEIFWASKIAENRKKIRLLMGEFPLLLLKQLQQLRASSESGRLPGNIMLCEGDETTAQKGIELLDELLDWSAEHQENFHSWNSKSPAMDIFRNEFNRRISNLGLRERFFEDSVATLSQKENNFSQVDSLEQKRKLEALSAVVLEAQQAKNVLVEANLRLVISIAKHYAKGMVPIADLIQEGNIGLMRAVETFDHELGHRFSTYATYWIRQSLGRAIALQGRSIRMPVNTLRQLSKIRQCERDILMQTGRAPETYEIAEKLGISTARVSALIKMSQQPISLHSIRSGDQEFGEIISDDKSPQPGEQIAFESLKETVRDALNTLDGKEKEVIMRRFGLDDHACETLEQIGKRLSLTSERVRQIETAALRKLRDPVKNKYFAGLE